MAKESVSDQIKQQKEMIAQSRKRIRDLKKQARQAQAKRMIKLAEKAGLFTVDIPDAALAEAFETLVKSAQSPSKANDVSA